MQPTSSQSGAVANGILDASELPTDPAAIKLRERYIAARFVQFPHPIQALKGTANVMRWARQLLDDDEPQLAAELLQFALQEDRSRQPLWLCLIELAYQAKDPVTFGELSDAFRLRFPDATTLPVINAMGNKLLPRDPRFAHATETVVMPEWSTPGAEHRDELRQRKLHEALVDAMAYQQAR
ncbi:MAG: hypothetical protein ABL931_09585 [Usitatibacteraceae bacterium]